MEAVHWLLNNAGMNPETVSNFLADIAVLLYQSPSEKILVLQTDYLFLAEFIVSFLREASNGNFGSC